MIKTGLLFFCLFICAITQAQEYAWTRDSSGVWNLDILKSNWFEQSSVSLNGETLLFTRHMSDDNDYTAPKETRVLLVSRVSPNGEPQVIRRLNFYARRFVVRNFNNHYYILTQEYDVRGNRHNNVILEYDSAWNFMCYTRVKLPHFQHYYTDFFPLGNQQFYLLSKGTEHGSYMTYGAYLVRSGRKGRVEYKRFFALKELRNLQVRNDSIYFSTHRRTLDYGSRPYKDSVYSYTCDSMLRGDGVFKWVTDFYYNGTKLPDGGHFHVKTQAVLDELTFFNRNNDSLWTWTAGYNWKIRGVIPVDSNRFVVSFSIFGKTDIEAFSEGAALILFDTDMNQTQLWQQELISKDKPPFFDIEKTYYSSATNSIQLIHRQRNHQGGTKLGFETVPLPE